MALISRFFCFICWLSYTKFIGSRNIQTQRMRLEIGAGRRIGFRTKSEVENLDDGYKWRKYGKKAVKNSPNPRCESKNNKFSNYAIVFICHLYFASH